MALTVTTSAPDSTATKKLVRKSIQDEALVTGWRPVSEMCQVVTARWPHQHSFYTEGGRYSPLLVTETLRQALALLTHAAHDIPLDHRLGWEQIRSTIDAEALGTDAGPAEVELLIVHTQVKRRRLGSVQLASHVEASRAGKPLGTASLEYTTHPPAIYDRLRGNYADAASAFARAIPLTPPVPASHVGRGDSRNVVLSPTSEPNTWQLRVDTSHSVLFDHPHDHIPGMVLLEAAAQAAQAAAMPRAVVPVAFDTAFFRYVEFDRPCMITTEPLTQDGEGHMSIKVNAHQGELPVLSSTVTLQAQPTR
ncbi:ScbA/BarX family gamma-butyrolactone biosynthesis protein [Streptomyces rectiviolaceus]|uniref:Gamma-butyrolactone biosynthesis protein ScbA n=1 Tax=Streptomyces rectiviolaceus TaxID=332591 RepID=A0ABP6MI06_9ACTN